MRQSQFLCASILGIAAVAGFVACANIDSGADAPDATGAAGTSAQAGSGAQGGGGNAGSTSVGGATATGGSTAGGEHAGGAATGGAGAGGTNIGGADGGAAAAGAANGGASAGGSGGSATGGATLALVINEISAKGDDWVELLNTGTEPFDLSGLALADKDSTTGGPNTSSALVFAAGTLVPPGSYVLVSGGHKDGGVGNMVETDCVDGGPSMCFWVSWKVSSKSGDTVYVLDDTGTPLLTVDYPVEVVSDGQSYGRLPDGTGPFAAARPTPGASNQAP